MNIRVLLNFDSKKFNRFSLWDTKANAQHPLHGSREGEQRTIDAFYFNLQYLVKSTSTQLIYSLIHYSMGWPSNAATPVKNK